MVIRDRVLAAWLTCCAIAVLVAFVATRRPANASTSLGIELAPYSTYLGGSLNDRGFGVTRLPDGRIVVVGSTSSPNFPTTPGSFQPSYGGGASDGFITVFSPDSVK